jgi:hypothetical protein
MSEVLGTWWTTYFKREMWPCERLTILECRTSTDNLVNTRIKLWIRKYLNTKKYIFKIILHVFLQNSTLIKIMQTLPKTWCSKTQCPFLTLTVWSSNKRNWCCSMSIKLKKNILTLKKSQLKIFRQYKSTRESRILILSLDN